jgi:hypothetical protein
MISSSYKYEQNVVAKTSHPAVIYVHYKLVAATINATGRFNSFIGKAVF